MKQQLVRVIKKSFLALALLLVSCSSLPSNYLNLNLGTEPPSLDWNLASDSASFDVISNLMIGLTKFDQDLEGNIIVRPACAKTWSISSDGKVYIFELDPRAKWSDGRELIAKDFLDSFARILDPKTAAPYGSLLSVIDLSASKAFGKHKLKIVLKEPRAYFLYLTAYCITLPIRKDLIDRYGDQWTSSKNLVVNGPFKLKEWRHEYKIILTKNPLCHLSQKQSVSGIQYFMIPEQASAYSLFKSGALDWIDNRSIPISEIKKLKNIQRISLLRNTYVGFNLQAKPFDNLKLRQALFFAIDRQALSNIIGKGDFANSTWIPPSLNNYLDYEYLLSKFQEVHGFKPSLQAYLNGYFPELARKLLKESQCKDISNIEFLIPNRDSTKLLAEALQAMWTKELNLKIKIRVLEWKIYLSELQKNPPGIFRMSWGADYPDPDTFMQLFLRSNPINYGKYSNSLYDNLVLKAASQAKDRKRLYSEAEARLTIQDAAIIPILIDSQNHLAKKNIHGITLNPLDIVFLDQVKKV